MTIPPPVKALVTRPFDAPPERVFDAWLDPATAGRWLFATPAGAMVRVEIDARVGGTAVIVERRAGEDAEHRLEYLEIDRPRRLAFTLRVGPDARDATTVSVDVTPRDGGCELTLTHELPPEWSEHVERTEQGWRNVLDGLAATLA